MQVAQGMRIDQAKRYVADKLGILVEDITGPVMRDELREGLDLGRVNAIPGSAKGIDAEFRIAEQLDIESNSVKKLKERTEM